MENLKEQKQSVVKRSGIMSLFEPCFPTVVIKSYPDEIFMPYPEQNMFFRVISIGKLKVKRAKQLIKDILYKGFITFITGCAKHGKSTLAWHLIVCLTTGKPFLGRFPVKGGKYRVLYCCLEDHLGEFKQKIKYMLQGKRFPKHFYILGTNSMSLPDDFRKLRGAIERNKIDVVIIDTFRRAHGKNEDNSSDMANVNNGLRELTKKTGVTAVVIHHKGKNKDQKEASDSLRGTSDFIALWETLIYVNKHKEKTDISVSHRGQKDLEDGCYRLILGNFNDKVTGEPPIIDLVYVEPGAKTHDEEERVVCAALKTKGASANDLTVNLKGKLSRSLIDAALDRLCIKGKAIRNGKGKNTKWHLQ